MIIGLIVVAALIGVLVGAIGPDGTAGASPAAARLGFMPNGKVAAFRSLESFVGRPARYVVQNADYRSTHAFESSVWGEVADAGQFQTLADRVTFVLSVPLTIGLPFGESRNQRLTALRRTAAGDEDAAFRYVSQLLVRGGFGDAIIRLGWEFDGDWMPWSAVGNEALWVQAYQHVHNVMIAVSPGFRFDWNGDPRTLQRESAAYPGDRYVDIVGSDVYDERPGIPWNPATKSWTDPRSAWSSLVGELGWQREFAIAHGKTLSFPEWGLSGVNRSVTRDVGGDDPAFVQGMYDWMNALPRTGPGSLEYDSYFNQDAGADHRLDAGHFPNATARFHALFGAKSSAGNATERT